MSAHPLPTAILGAFAAMVLTHVQGVSAAEPVPKLAPTKDVGAFYSEHCIRCHKEGKAKGGFRMDQLLAKPTVEGLDGPWKNVLDKLAGREMPPDDEEKRPSDADYETQVAWLRGELSAVESIAALKRPRYLRRLNRVEYSNITRELFGLDLRAGDDLPPDEAIHGFDTVAEGQNLSAVHVEQLLKTAERVVNAVVRESEWPGLKRDQKLVPGGNPDDFGASVMWGFKSARGTLWTFRALGPGGHGPVTESGVYRARFRLVPHHLKGAPGKVEVPPGRVAMHDFTGPSAPHLAGFFAGREIAESHIRPEQDGQEVVVDLLGYLPKGTEVSEIELRYVNGTPGDIGLQKRGISDRPEDRPSSPEAMPRNFPFLLVTGKELTGPLPEFWRTPEVRRFLEPGLADGDPAKSLAVFLPRAFRRPVSPDEIEAFAKIARAEMGHGASFIAALKTALTAALVSPEFLFVVEEAPVDREGGPHQLSDHELATRLSLFLWSSLPDEALQQAAAHGELRTPAGRAGQVARMLADPRSAALEKNFVPQWLGLGRLASAMPERTLFVEFNWLDEMYEFYGTRLLANMRREPGAFFTGVLAEDRPITDFLVSDYVYVDESLARLYGLTGVYGGEFRKVSLAGKSSSQRGGLLGMAAMLTLTSESTRTSPVIRGTWLLKRLFNRPPPPPPPNAGTIEPDTGAARSLREKLALHRQASQCAGCHARIDPYGLTLENFDAIGRWRGAEPAWFDPARPDHKPQLGTDGKPVQFPIDASAELANGRKLDGLIGLRSHLLDRKDDFARGLAEKLLVYSTGRGLLVSDGTDVDHIVARTRERGYRLRALLEATVQSDAFLKR